MDNAQPEKKDGPSILQSVLVLAATVVGLAVGGAIVQSVFGE